MKKYIYIIHLQSIVNCRIYNQFKLSVSKAVDTNSPLLRAGEFILCNLCGCVVLYFLLMAKIMQIT